jgi:hypothetical protein
MVVFSGAEVLLLSPVFLPSLLLFLTVTVPSISQLLTPVSPKNVLHMRYSHARCVKMTKIICTATSPEGRKTVASAGQLTTNRARHMRSLADLSNRSSTSTLQLARPAWSLCVRALAETCILRQLRPEGAESAEESVQVLLSRGSCTHCNPECGPLKVVDLGGDA